MTHFFKISIRSPILFVCSLRNNWHLAQYSISIVKQIINRMFDIIFFIPQTSRMKCTHYLVILLLATYLVAAEDSTNQMNGPGNLVYYGTGNIANGRDNTFRGNDNLANGNHNDFVGDTNHATGVANQISGVKNNVEGHVNSVEGVENSVSGSVNGISGQQNCIKGYLNSVDGARNQVQGLVNSVSGENNSVKGLGNQVQGQNNQVVGAGNFVASSISAEDEQNMMANIQNLIMSRLSQRLGA